LPVIALLLAPALAPGRAGRSIQRQYTSNSLRRIDTLVLSEVLTGSAFCCAKGTMERLDITGIEGLTDAQQLVLKRMSAVEHLSRGEWNKHEL
jgi:hypothetical protein